MTAATRRSLPASGGLPRPYSRTRAARRRAEELALYGSVCVRCGRGILRPGRCPVCGRVPLPRYRAACRR